MIGYEHFDVGALSFRKHMGAIIPLSFPHVENDLPRAEIKKLLKFHGAYFMRWDTKFDNEKEGCWWHIIKDIEEDITALPKKTRYQIRKGLDRYEIKKVEKSLIVDEGYDIYRPVFAQYNTVEEPVNCDQFVEAIKALPAFTEFWGVFEKDSSTLIGFSENIVMDGACFYLSIWLGQEAMRNFASYSLFHVMNVHYLNTCKLKYVSDGARSISHDTNIHEFLQSKFGFRKAYSKLNIEYRFWFGALVNMLYPFRSIFTGFSGDFLKKVNIILFQEQIRRECLQHGKG